MNLRAYCLGGGLVALLSLSASAQPAEPASEAESPQQAATVRRDPFRPFILDLRPAAVAEPLTPLQQYELRQLTVTAVLWDLKPPVAMVEDSAGMGFIVSPGTPIGNHGGVVTAIEPGRIIVEEKAVDFYGREEVRKVALEIVRSNEPQRVGRE